MVEIGLVDLEVFLIDCECGVIVKTEDKEVLLTRDEFKREFKAPELKKIYYIDDEETKIMLIDKNDVQTIIEMV